MLQIINWRLIISIILIILSIIQESNDLHMAIFIYSLPNYKCNANSTELSNNQCYYKLNNVTYECKSWKYDQTYMKSTVITELNLVCNKGALQLILLPITIIVFLVSILYSYLSDRYGRKPLIIFTAFFDTIMWIIICLVPLTYTLHLILRILKSMARGTTTIGFVLLTESTPYKYRENIIHHFLTAYGLGIGFSSLYMYLMKYWRSAYLLSSILSIYALFTPFILLESPRWLLINGKREKAKKVLIKLGQFTNEEEMDEYFSSSILRKTVEMKNEYSDCLKSKTLVLRYIILFFGSFMSSCIYIGTSTNLSFANSNIFLSNAIMGLIQIPACFVTPFLCYKFGDVRTLTISGILCVLLYMISPSNYSEIIRLSKIGIISHTILATLSKFVFTITWSVYHSLSLTGTPTSLRSSSFALFKTAAIFGSTVGSLITNYFVQQNAVYWANLIFGAFMIIAVFLTALFIPTMTRHNLPNSVKEAENIKNHIPCCKSDEYSKLIE